MDISILIPAIRPHLWNEVYQTIQESCKRYAWEVIFAGPFPPPAELASKSNLKFIKTYRCPSSTAQMAAISCEGRLLLHSVDDSRWVPDAVDKAVDLYNSINDRKTVINMRYTENDNYSGKTFEDRYWNAHHHPALALPGVSSHYRIALHFLMDCNYFRELGGFDCSYIYQNFNLHDLMFRIQHDGGQVLLSPTDVTNCNHYRGGDHSVIEVTHDIDYTTFRNRYTNPHALHADVIRIPYSNWEQQPEVWGKRFPRLFNSYEEMMG